MKKIIVILCILLLTGCVSKEKILTNIKINKNNIEYGEEIYLYDLLSIENGSISTKNYLIDTSKLKNDKKIVIKYEDYYKKNHKYEFKISIVDTTKPLILGQNNYYITEGEEFDLINSPICVDNYDRDLKCELEGTYDVNTIGEYPLKLTLTDSNGNYSEKNIKLFVEEESDDYYETSEYRIEDLITKYKTKDTMIGIDVSSWQDIIDWNKVKNSGVEFAMIRIGWGHDDNNQMEIDNQYERNIKEAKKAGVKVGLYFYSYAKDIKEAKEQAKWILKTVNKKKLDLPIAFDWEDWGNFMDYKFNLIDINSIAKTFMKEIEKKGYESMNYGSARYLENIWNLPKYPTWLAYYTENNDYNNDFMIWQISNKGIVDGINGYVDLNILYK